MTFAPDPIDVFREPLCEKHNFRGTPCISCLTEKIPRWIPATIETTYDGDYLCALDVPQECGNIWKIQRVRSSTYNKWILEPGEIITHYQKLPKHP